ncbi:MAG: DNA primase, partial [Candidatus Sungiibacteriota bacterium]
MLGARAGIEIARENPALRSERNRLYDACEAAARIFERRLLLTAEPKEYLKARGMTEETARAFRVGFAPPSWDFLLRGLAGKGFKPEEVEHAGLAIRSDKNDGSRYDRFRSRIIFPITDANARVIGFGG